MMSEHSTNKLIDILIVDDSRADRMLIRVAFEKAGGPLRLHMCDSGEDALDFLYKRGPHEMAPTPKACLMDVKMPGMTGIEVLATVKEDPALRGLPVVMFSSSDNDADIRNSYANHASGYIQKPMDSEQLFEFADVLTRLWTDMLKYPDVTRFDLSGTAALKC